MTPEVIQEARRLIRDLIFHGRAKTTGGRTIEPKDEVFVTLLEKVAAKKVEEPDVPQTVEGFTPRQTFHAIAKDQPPRGE